MRTFQILTTLMLLVFCSNTQAVMVQESFDTDSADTATTLGLYPQFQYAGAGDATVVNGELQLSTTGAGSRNFFFTTESVGDSVRIAADISKAPAGGSFNAGLVIGDNNIVFHPGFAPTPGAFRVEGPGGFGNQNMGFVPSGHPVLHHFEAFIAPDGNVDITVTNGDNPSQFFKRSYTSTYTPGDRVGFTVEGGAGVGVFDNLQFVVPELRFDADGVNQSMIITSGGSAWDVVTFPPSGRANIYFDENSNGIFGESGENTGNTASTLGFSINPIESGRAYEFGMEGFTNAADTGTLFIDLILSDQSVIDLVIAEGSPVTFRNSDGSSWVAEFEFNPFFYGDVVFNGNTTAGQNVRDHQGVLTLTQIPEPTSAALLGLGSLFMMRRKRRYA